MKVPCVFCWGIKGSGCECDIHDHSKSYTCFGLTDDKNGIQFVFDDSIDLGMSKHYDKMTSLVCSMLIRSPYYIGADGRKLKYYFIYDEDESVVHKIDDAKVINMANYINEYPANFNDRIDKILLNLSYRYNDYGTRIQLNQVVNHLFYCNTRDHSLEIESYFYFLDELGYINITDRHGEIFTISAVGWRRVLELQKQEAEINQAFIAMKFGPDTDYISKVFKTVIRKCGYYPRRIDEKQHNNQIVPEMFFEIKRSKFVVVDVTQPNLGAYYEAGYAEALGKQVIVCCKRDVFNSNQKPHFDISQKSTVIWDDEKDLSQRLYDRVEATVGITNYSFEDNEAD